MIYRFQYTAYLNSRFAELGNSVLNSAKAEAKNKIADKTCITIALYRYDNMLFLYCESADNRICAENLLPSLTECLDGNWLAMKNVYYTSVPVSDEYWSRQGKKTRIGRLARLMPGKVNSYVRYHKAIMEEGLFEGEKYLCISLYGNTLFLYSESPAIMTHIRQNLKGESEVINEWRKLNPKSHFDHGFSGESNFITIEEIFSAGREDILNEQYI
ncbi:MAG: hypothetical protein IJ460_05155 [Clostridia bacterium]|nr:hypothetical protein [Clostridia bacterium]